LVSIFVQIAVREESLHQSHRRRMAFENVNWKTVRLP